MEPTARIEVGYPELDIAAAIVLLKAYAGTTANFPARVLLVGNSAWRDAAIQFLNLQRKARQHGETVSLKVSPAVVCDTPYKSALLQ